MLTTQNKLWGLPSCQKQTHTHTHSYPPRPIVPQQHTNKDGKAIWEPKCLQFCPGCCALTQARGLRPVKNNLHLPASPPASADSIAAASQRRGPAVVICGLSPAHFVAAGQWVALLISCLGPAGCSLNEGLWKYQQNTDQSPSCWRKRLTRRKELPSK